MPEQPTAWEDLRAQYDAALLDVHQRNLRAQRLREALQSFGVWPQSGYLLDVGCGSGLMLAAMDGTAARRIGCDVRRTLFPAPQPALGLHFVQCDGARLPFANGQFNLVVSLAVIGEFPDWRGALADMARCVAPGGALYITVANGRLLVPLYTVLQRLGRPTRPVHWAYARACARLAAWPAHTGYDIPALRGWRFLHISPHVARGTWPWLRLVPSPLLEVIARRCAPAFAFGWQRPRQGLASTDSPAGIGTKGAPRTTAIGNRDEPS